MTTTQILFYIFSALLIISTFSVVLSRNPVRGALFLVSSFVMSACIWLMMQAEFLGLILILVYVGAVMTLFLFVVMMLNLENLPKREGLKRYWPFAIVILVVIAGLTFYVTAPEHFSLAANPQTVLQSADYSNVGAIGSVLYTQYVYAFEIAAIILLVAIIAAISLAFRGWATNSKRQNISKQVQTQAKDRLRIVKDLGSNKP